MAEKNASLTERSKKRSNGFWLLLGLALLIIGGMAYMGLQGGYYGQRVAEQPVDLTNDPDSGIKKTSGDFDEFRSGEGFLEASPTSVDMNGVVLGSQAEAIVTLTAKQVPIQFIGMELAEEQDGGFLLAGSCEPNKVIPKDGTCSIKVMWNPVTLRQIQNTLNIRWKEDYAGVFDEGHTEISLRAQSTDSKDCVICETPCKDKETVIDRRAALFDGQEGIVEDQDGVITLNGEKYIIKGNKIYDKNGKPVGTVNDDGTVTINGEKYQVKDNLLLDKDGKVVGTIERGGSGTVTIGGATYAVKDDLIIDKDGNIIGIVEPEKIPLALDNKLMGTISKSGDVVGKDGTAIGRLLGDDTIVDSSLNVLGAAVPVISVMNPQGKVIGKVMKDGTVVDGAQNVIGRPMVDGSVVNLEGTPVGYLRPFGLVVNWTGEVIGGVVSDGRVINGKKQKIATVKPNGLAVSSQGELVGGVVPRGIAVGAGCQALGRVLMNGQVQDSFSQVVGRTLLNGSVINDKGMDVGTVVRMGLVINDKSGIVGFVNSEGKAVDSKGALIGCVNPDGTVSAGAKIVGAVMPKGYAMGRNCGLIGSVYPNGVVMNAAVDVVGVVRPDAHVVNMNNKTIGVVVPRGGAIADGCRLLGLITPEGQVIDENGLVIGCVTPEKQIINRQKEIIGFVAPMGLVVDKSGKVIGRTRMDGKVIDNDGNVIGCVNSDGSVSSVDGKKIIGQVVGSVPGEGVVLDANGEATDMKVVGSNVYGPNGELIGTLTPNHWVVNANGEIVGVIPPDGVIFGHNGTILGRYTRKTGLALNDAGEKIGVVLSDHTVLNTEKTEIIGLLMPDNTPFIKLDGSYLATMNIEGLLQNEAGESLGGIKSDGTVVDRAGQVVGVKMPQGRVFSVLGQEVGTVNDKGEILSEAKSVIGHILGNGIALSNSGQIIGGIFPDISLPIGADGILGALTYQGRINDSRGRQIGVASPFGTIFGNKDNLSGRLLRIGPYVNAVGQLVGWANFKGGVNDKTGDEIGTVTVAGVALDRDNRVLGTLVPRGIVVDNKGAYMTGVSTNGAVLTADGQNAGWVNGYNYVSNERDGVVGQILPAGVAINAEGGLIGWTRFDGLIEDGRNAIGSVALDGQVIHADGSILGTYIPLGSLVMNDKSGFMGIVNEKGQIVNSRGEPVAYAVGDTYAFNNGQVVGRIIQSSLAVNDNVNGKLLGMAGADGVVMVANDNKPLGRLMANGFAIDLTKKVVGGLAPVGLPIATNLSNMGAALSVGQVAQGEKVVGAALQMGAIYDPTGQITGGMMIPSVFVDRNGAIIGRSSGSAMIVSKEGKKLASYMPFGSALTPDTIWAGGAMPKGLVVNDDGFDIGVVTLDGTIIGKESVMMGRILSDGTAVGLSDKNLFTTMPYAGHTVKQGLPFGYRNQVLGRTTVTGDIIDSSDKKVYRELDDGTILGKEMPIDGAVLSFNPATGHKGELLGVLDGEGNVISYTGEEKGKIAVNGAVKGNHKYKILGILVPEPLVVNECKVIGQTSYNGQVVNGQGNVVGYVTPGKWAVDNAGNQIGRVVRTGLVASPTGDYIGRTLPDSTVVDLNGVNMGCARNDRTVVNGSGDVIGHVVERGLVLDKEGKPIARVTHDGTVKDKTGKVIGKALGDGKGTIVDMEGNEIGRVVSPNEELMFNKDGTIGGTFDDDGYFTDNKGVKQFRVLPNGDIIDPNTGEKIATLTEDGRLLDPNGNEVSDIRVVRDKNGNFIGLLDDYNNVINTKGQTIGKVDESGIIRDLTGKIMDDWVLSGVDLEDVAPKMKQTAGNTGRKIYLGKDYFDVTSNGSLVDKEGNIIGYMGEDGRPYSLSDRPLVGPESPTARPDIKKPTPITEDQRIEMDNNLANRRAAMKAKIRSFDRMLPDVRVLARAREKKDLDWGEAKTISTYPVDMSRMILKDKAIPCVLVHAVDSRYGSVPVTAIVERHIYAEQGRRIIIPAGSRLIGSGGGGGSGHVAKVNFTWSRLIRPDGSAFKLSATSGDAMGRGGVPAYLDEQLLKKYGRPVLQSTITSAISFLTATNDDITTKQNGDQVISSRAQAANDARNNFIDSMSQIFNQLLQEALQVQEVLYVPAGTRFTIYPSTDLWLRSEIEDEQDYLAAYGADTKRARPASKGNWIDPRLSEASEMAAEQGYTADVGGDGLVADDGYYDPDVGDPSRAGTGGASAVYDGAAETEKEEPEKTKEEPVKPKEPKKKQQISDPIFPRAQQQTGTKKLF